MKRAGRSECRSRKNAARRLRLSVLALCLGLSTTASLRAQSPTPTQPASTADAQRLAEMDRRLSEVTAALDQTQKTLEQSLQEIQRLRAELDALNAQRAQLQPDPATPPAAVIAATPSSSSQAEEITALKEKQQVLEAEVKQLDQTKVETSSKYRLRVNGLALFNAFANAGVVDNVSLPTLALQRYPGSAHGSLGGTLQQSLLGFEATGPTLAAAHTSASVSVDFFGGVSTNSAGYTSAAGIIRMRQVTINLDWPKALLQVGYTSPLISPFSPTSFANVAEPALSGSGNLWVWSPQVRFEQRIPISGQRGLAIEGGLISPQSSGYTAVQFDSTVQASRRPGVEGRLSWRSDLTGLADRSLILGIGAYTASQFYKSNSNIHAWAATADWQVPLTRWFDFSGELYRGNAIGGLGGGQYKDVLSGTSITTGLATIVGVDAAGGWSQLKTRFSPILEANAVFGMDDAYSGTFDKLNLPSGTSVQTYAARSQTTIGNIIFRPRSYLIFSPEYRRLLTWPYTGPANIANIFTLSVGYQF